jgi:hypothetical protein
LPLPSKEGRNIFGCLAEGNVWQNDGHTRGAYGSCPPNIIYSSLIKFNSDKFFRFNISGRMTYANTDQSFNFTVKLPSFSISNTYNITEANFENIFDKKLYSVLDTTNLLSRPRVNFTKIDTVNRIVSGQFSGDILSVDRTKRIVIRDGRFDVTYR